MNNKSRNRNRNRNQRACDQIPESQRRSFDKESHHSYNDVKWYVPNDEILRSAASISFENASGDSLGVGRARVPGIMAADMAITYGVSRDAVSPLNVCARESYSRLMTGLTSYGPFEANDYMMYLLAMDSIYCMFNAIKRVYGVYRHFEYKNRYTPQAIVAAMGIDYTSIGQNLSDIWFSLNYWSNQISKFAVPQTMSVFIRHSWLSSNIYKDGSNDKSQMYMFNPRVIYRYDASSDDPKGKLTAIESGFNSDKINSGLTTWSTLKTTMNTLLEHVNQQQDFDVISAYVLKKYESNLFTLGTTPADYEVSPVYDESVLLQFHNMSNYGFTSISEFTITQELSSNAGIAYLRTVPKSSYTNVVADTLYLDLVDKEADPNTIMEASRLMSTIDPTSQIAGAINTFGGDTCLGATIFYYIRSTNGELLLGYKAVPRTFVNIPTSYTGEMFEANAMLSKFDYAPIVYYVELDEQNATSAGIVKFTSGNLGNYTVVSGENIDQLNNVAIMGLLGLIE